MKNQWDLIISATALVIAFIIAGICYGTKRTPTKPPEPTKVNLAQLALPNGDVKYANSLPGGGGRMGGGGGAAGGGGFAPGSGAGGRGGGKQLGRAPGGGG